MGQANYMKNLVNTMWTGSNKELSSNPGQLDFPAGQVTFSFILPCLMGKDPGKSSVN